MLYMLKYITLRRQRYTIRRGDMNINFDRHTMRTMAIVQRKYRAMFDRKLEAYNLNNKTFGILRTIKNNKEISQPQLTQIHKTDKAAIARGVMYLEKMGLIDRQKDEKDSRKYILSVTDKGNNLFDDIHELHHKIAAIALDGLDEETLDILDNILLHIESNIKNYESKERE